MWRALTVVAWVVLAGPAQGAGQETELLVATTTSVRDSGLLDALLPRFEAEAGIRVRAIAVGSGAALRMGAQGNVDVLITHAPRAEAELLTSGAVLSRTPFMENYFVIAGPPEDPAGVARAATAPAALRRIHDTSSPYVSRGDDSGTHKREVELLQAAGLDPGGGWPGFASTGSGMGLSLQVAGERRAYILSDMGTFLAFSRRTDLVALSRPEAALRNEYSVLRVNGLKFPRVHGAAAQALEGFLLRPDVQRRIGEVGREEYGRSLFRPLHLAPPAQPLPPASPDQPGVGPP